MTETAKEVVVKSKTGEVVGRMNLENGVLHGHCEWYDGWGNLVACGYFKNGAPFAGTFLNWTKFFGHVRQEEPYDPTVYCQDWVTIFESGFDSEPPKYDKVIEAYSRGTKISLIATT